MTSRVCTDEMPCTVGLGRLELSSTALVIAELRASKQGAVPSENDMPRQNVSVSSRRANPGGQVHDLVKGVPLRNKGLSPEAVLKTWVE